jgi:hypothetical protein
MIRLPNSKTLYSPTSSRFGASRGAFLRAVTLGLCLLMLGACATSPAARDKAIQERAQARWDALLAKDYATAYEYLSPGYRSATSATDFEIAFRSRRLQYQSAEYQGHDCEESACTVRMKLGYKIVRPVAGLPEWKSDSVVQERWINSSGKWWYLPDS